MGYEYLLAGLPELKAGVPSPISIDELLSQLEEQVKNSDRSLLDQ